MEQIKKAQPNHYGVTSLDPGMLSSLAPRYTFGGGALIGNAADFCFVWRSCSTQKMRGGTIGFYLADDRLETLWRAKERYAVEFRLHGVVSAVEPDFSLWCDQPIEEQLHSIRRTRIVGRLFQEAGLLLVPNLNWADERSFPFAFAGIPVGAPVVMTECRTAGGTDADRRAFLKGLEQGVKEVLPQHVCIYGGREHAYWLADRLPAGPTYSLLEAWTSARGRIRANERRLARNHNQLTFGGEQWAEEAVAAA
jgi:hypothetical protein